MLRVSAGFDRNGSEIAPVRVMAMAFAIAVREAREGVAVAVHCGADAEGAEATFSQILDDGGDGRLV